MQRKPPYFLATQETEDCSSEEIQKSRFINSLEQATIIDVWADNFHQQMKKISSLTKKYNIIAIDTQFPSIQEYNQKFDYSTAFQYEKYLKLAKNVDNTALIQLGLCLSDQDGNVPIERFCWQFNFKFQGEIEEISAPSAFLLKKAGINFDKFLSDGISYNTFTHQFIKSGLLLNKRNRWIVFHGGYDFSYLLKLIRNQPLPRSTQDFYKSIKIYFPHKIDIKSVLQKDKRLKKLGLSKLADSILCRRIGPEHQAGSDALLTLQCYFKLKCQFQDLFQHPSQFQNIIFGIGASQAPKADNNFSKQYNFPQIYPTDSPYFQNNYINYAYGQNTVFYPTNYQSPIPKKYGNSGSKYRDNPRNRDRQ